MAQTTPSAGSGGADWRLAGDAMPPRLLVPGRNRVDGVISGPISPSPRSQYCAPLAAARSLSSGALERRHWHARRGGQSAAIAPGGRAGGKQKRVAPFRSASYKETLS